VFPRFVSWRENGDYDNDGRPYQSINQSVIPLWTILNGNWRHISRRHMSRNDKNTSLQCYASCTGFQSVNECGSNWPVSCTSRYLVRPPSTWSIMSSYLLTAVSVYFDQPTTEHASFHGHRTVSATEPLLKSETICHRNCNTWTSALDNSEICWNRISLGFSQPRRIVNFWLFRLTSFLPSLLTYIYMQKLSLKPIDILLFYYCNVWHCNAPAAYVIRRTINHLPQLLTKNRLCIITMQKVRSACFCAQQKRKTCKNSRKFFSLTRSHHLVPGVSFYRFMPVAICKLQRNSRHRPDVQHNVSSN